MLVTNKKYILGLALFIISIFQAPGQTAAPAVKVMPPSPEVSVMQKYGEYGCSGYTGMVDINIPLFEITSNQLHLPVSVKYVSNGKKVVSDRSSVGTGWMLDAGGIVSRTIFGSPDLDVDWAYSLKPAAQYYDFKANYDTLSRLAGVGLGYLDSEYDIFSYSFGSYSGRFIIDQKKDKKNFVLLKQEPVKIEYSNFNFILYDEQGNQYKFGENGAAENSKDNLTSKQINRAWYPTSIISADKKDTISLKYNTFWAKSRQFYVEYVVEDNFNRYYDDLRSSSIGDRSGWQEPEHVACRISEINYRGGKVKFNYNASNQDKLESISLTNMKGEVTKTITFESTLKGSTSKGGAYYLDKLIFKGQGTDVQNQVYSFDYYTPFEFNPQNCDWWGYANKLTDGYLMGIPYTTYTLFERIKGSSTNSFGTNGAKDTNASAILSGMLKMITYPTGGKTTFEYESNKFSYGTTVVTGNGLRVLRLTNDDGTGKTNIKTYQYGTNGSGYYPNMPKLDYYSRIFHFAYTTYNCLRYSDPTYCYGSFRQRRYNTGLSSSASEELCRPVQYETVTEYMGDAVNNTGKTDYKYKIAAGGSISGLQAYNGIPSESFIMPADLWHYHVPTLNDYAGGCLLEKTVWKNENGIYKEAHKIVNSYDFKNLNTYTGMRVVNLIVADVGCSTKASYLTPTESLAKFYDLPVFLYSDYSITVGACVLNKTEEYVDGVLKLTENTYNSNYLPKTVSLTDSRNNKTTTAFTYSTDIDNIQGSIFSDMSKNNMTGIPVETVTSIRKEDGIDYVTGATVNLYKNNTGAIYPEKIYTLSIYSPITNYQKLTGSALVDSRMNLDITFEKYDSKGNILQITDNRTSIPTVYLWGYNYQHPIAEIKGVAYSDVTGKIAEATLNAIAAKNELNASDSTTINNLRTQLSNAQVTTYTYKPLVGMQSMTDPRGVVTNYNYDSFGRLKSVVRAGKQEEWYDYHYKN
jgi:YD repeat-containing protein